MGPREHKTMFPTGRANTFSIKMVGGMMKLITWLCFRSSFSVALC
jgi:hypothetical protein